MAHKTQIKDTVLGIDIKIKPYTPHINCYVIKANFHNALSKEEDCEVVFEIPAQSKDLLQTVLELSLYQAKKTDNYLGLSAERIFSSYLNPESPNTYWNWLEQHPNFLRKDYEPRMCAKLHNYLIFYYDTQGMPHEVEFKLTPELQTSIRLLNKEFPQEREQKLIDAYRAKAVIFIEKQILEAELAKKTNVAPLPSFKI